MGKSKKDEDEDDIEIVNLSDAVPIVPDAILKGKLSLDELPEPYLLIVDRAPGLEKLSKVINVIARKTDYRITFFSVTPYFGYVIMEKKSSGGGM